MKGQYRSVVQDEDEMGGKLIFFFFLYTNMDKLHIILNFSFLIYKKKIVISTSLHFCGF